MDFQNFKPENIYELGEDFCGANGKGEVLSFTNYYMQKNGKPFFGISGEFHFSRMSDMRWEDELIKMKMGGLNVVTTYVFWNHHEEREGIFDFTGRRNLKKFVRLCAKHGFYVILRVGPFDHGEARNGGLPDWLYGKPFEVRKLNDGFLYHVKRLYTEIGRQVDGLFFKDNGPIIGVQIDNEYMHSSAPWEMTTGVSDEWVFGGDEGNEYMLRLKSLAAECGLLPVFYTCTGWGGAATPDSMMPLWGGYAYRPWIFYSHKGSHPSTEEYVYQDFHDDKVICTNDFKPSYKPQTRPYACCEMGGGMMCSYRYRFRLPYKSVDAMANIKLASGCNFLGYYMFQGGSNPTGYHGGFLNESQVPKISYDYQAAIGEFGQLRESYGRLKAMHLFLNLFEETFCRLETVLPEGASDIKPDDRHTLRYAVRTDGHKGFLFLNNFQDHEEMPDRSGDQVTLKLPDGETLAFSFGLAGEENAILPFHMALGEIELVTATAQPVAKIKEDGREVYVFLRPEGMQAKFLFESGVSIEGSNGGKLSGREYCCAENVKTETFSVHKGAAETAILLVDRELANQMFCIGHSALLFTEAAVLADESGIRLETTKAVTEVFTYPSDFLENDPMARRVTEGDGEILGRYFYHVREKRIPLELQQAAFGRYTVKLPETILDGVKDVRLRIGYIGDIGQAFLNGRLVHDNFCNGAVWEIGLKELAAELAETPLTIYVTPLKENVNVNVESAMAARLEEVGKQIARVDRVEAMAVYEIPVQPKGQLREFL